MTTEISLFKASSPSFFQVLNISFICININFAKFYIMLT